MTMELWIFRDHEAARRAGFVRNRHHQDAEMRCITLDGGQEYRGYRPTKIIVGDMYGLDDRRLTMLRQLLGELQSRVRPETVWVTL